MPHAFVSGLKKDIAPCTVGELELIGFFSADRYSLAFVKMEGVKFALSIKEKDGVYLIKPEKLTRPSKLNLIKGAISIFCEAFCNGVISSNTILKKERPKSPKLLDPRYFCEHPDFFDCDVAVEVGFGSGRHLLYRAKEEPHKKFVGIEIYKPSIEQVLRQCELQGIDNIYLVNFDARLLIETMKKNSVSEVYVHFPVPWPGSPTRRIISTSFLKICSEILKDGGFVELRSDDREYFEYAFGCAMELEKTRVDANKNEPARVVSKYEDRWLKKGKDIFEMRIFPNKAEDCAKAKEEFLFGGRVTLESARALPKGAMVDGGVLVSFEELLLADNGDFAIKVTFGDVARPDRRYIVSLDGEISYYPFAPLCVKAGTTAHKIIKEHLYGKNS